MQITVRTADRVVLRCSPTDSLGAAAEGETNELLSDAQTEAFLAALDQAPHGGVVISPDHAEISTLPAPPAASAAASDTRTQAITALQNDPHFQQFSPEAQRAFLNLVGAGGP